MLEPAPELTYASPPQWYQTRRFQRWLWRGFSLVIAPFVIAGLWLVGDFAHDAWTARQDRAAFAACETYSPPAEQVVFEMTAGRVRRRLVAPPWEEWWRTSMWLYPTVFLHSARDQTPTQFTPATQLVAVEISPFLMYTYDGRTVLDRPLLCFETKQVWKPSPRGNSAGTYGSTKLVVFPRGSDRIRVFAGQTLSDSPDAFEFVLEYNGVRQKVRGQLKHGVVLLEPQDGESLRPHDWRCAVFWVPNGASAEQAEQTRRVAESDGQPSQTSWPLPQWWMTGNGPASSSASPDDAPVSQPSG